MRFLRVHVSGGAIWFFHFGSIKSSKISIIFEDLSRVSVFFSNRSEALDMVAVAHTPMYSRMVIVNCTIVPANPIL